MPEAPRIAALWTPANFPIQPTKFELIVNLTTVKALDLRIPSSLLVRADELID